MNSPNNKRTAVKNSLGGMGALSNDDFAPDLEVLEKKKTPVAKADSEKPRVISKPASTSSVIRKQTAKTDIDKSRSTDNITRAETTNSAPEPKRSKMRVGMERRFDEITRTSLVLPTEVHDKLHEIAFANRKTTRESFNDIVLESIDQMLRSNHGVSVDELVSAKR